MHEVAFSVLGVARFLRCRLAHDRRSRRSWLKSLKWDWILRHTPDAYNVTDRRGLLLQCTWSPSRTHLRPSVHKYPPLSPHHRLFFFLSFFLSLSLFFFFFHRSHSIRGLYLITPTTILQLFYPLFEMSYWQPFIDNVVTRSEDEFQACVESVTTLQDRPNGHVPEGQPFRYTEFDSWVIFILVHWKLTLGG